MPGWPGGLFLLSLLLSLAYVSLAQTPDGFLPASQSKLKVFFGSNSVSPAGELMTQAETATKPSLSTPNWGLTGSRALLMMIDIDVPSSSTQRGTLLHWFVPDVTISSSGTDLIVPDPNTTIPPGASYISPSPPSGDFPHRYVLLLVQQPDTFSLPAGFTDIKSMRSGFDAASFIAKAGLGSPIAGSFFTVQNTTGAQASQVGSGFPPANSGETNVVVPSNSAFDMKRNGERRWVWQLTTLAMVAWVANCLF